MGKNKRVLCTISIEEWEWANENDYSFSKILSSAIKHHKEKIRQGVFGREL